MLQYLMLMTMLLETLVWVRYGNDDWIICFHGHVDYSNNIYVELLAILHRF